MSKLLKFNEIIDGVQDLVKGFTPDKMADSLNDAQEEFASTFYLDFLKRKYYVNTTVYGGPFLVYEDSAYATEADWLEPVEKGLVDNNSNGVKFRLEGDSIYIPDSEIAFTTPLRFWCIKNPSRFSNSVSTNTLDSFSDWPRYAKKALCHLTAHYLAERKKDYERAKYFLDMFIRFYGPKVKRRASGNWGIDNYGQSLDDRGNSQRWI